MRTYVHRDWLTQSDYTSGLQTLFDHANLKNCIVCNFTEKQTPDTLSTS